MLGTEITFTVARQARPAIARRANDSASKRQGGGHG